MEIALGRSEMEVPAELWLSADGGDGMGWRDLSTGLPRSIAILPILLHFDRENGDEPWKKLYL